MKFKFFAIFTNEKAFRSHEFGDKSINMFAQIKWFPINTFSRSDYVLQIFRSKIELHDELIDMGSLTMKFDDGMVIERLPSREMAYD